MAKTRTSGITVDAAGHRIVNKQVCGQTVFRRLGPISQEEAEQWLAGEVHRIGQESRQGTRPRVVFREAARRYLEENGHLSSIDDAALHLIALEPFIADLELGRINDETLRPFKQHRLEVDGVSLTTVNRALEIVRRIANLAAKRYRWPNGMTWLELAPAITIETREAKRRARKPYPLSWEEQRILFSQLPLDPNAQMALFKVNTGCREQEVCALEWEWEMQVPELATSVFLIPAIFSEDGRHGVKNREDRLVVMNEVARSVIEARRGVHPRYVFTWRGKPSKKRTIEERGPGKPLDCMNNTAWQHARIQAAEVFEKETGKPAQEGFRRVRIHDLKHTFGRRLRAAGVAMETRQVLLGHTTGSITTEYSAAELAELIEAVNKIDASRSTPAITILRVSKGGSLAKVEQQKERVA